MTLVCTDEGMDTGMTTSLVVHVAPTCTQGGVAGKKIFLVQDSKSNIYILLVVFILPKF